MVDSSLEAKGRDITVTARDLEANPSRQLGRRMALALDENLIACVLLSAALLFDLFFLYPEIAIKIPFLNDGVLHLLVLGRTVVALVAGQDPTDNWLGTIAMGYPLFHYYQHLPYLIPAAGYFLNALFLRQMFSLADVYNWTGYLLLCLFPISIYWSMRRLGFARLTAALGGLVSSLISTNGLYGLEFGSYVWGGYGLYTQLWGMFLLPMAVAQSYVTLKEGRGYFWSIVLVAATVLSHVVAGYIALGSLVFLVLLAALGKRADAPANDRSFNRIKRLVFLLLLVGVVTSYFIIPFLQDSVYLNRSVWELPGKYDSYGYQWILTTLARGDLFDFGRWPILTMLAIVGLAFCLWHWREERYRVPAFLTLAWLLLYFGRPTWGGLLDLLPMSRDLQLHRLIIGVHLGGILLMGIGLAIPWNWALARSRAIYWLAPAILTALVLLPVYQERMAYLAQNQRWMIETQNAFAREEKDVQALVQAIEQLPPGRVYAGFAGNWGKNYTIGAVPMYAILNSAGLDMIGYLYHALSLNAEVQPLFDDGRQDQYDLFNIRYVVTPADWTVPSFYKPLGDFGRHRLYQVETSGYFDVVESNNAFAGDKSSLYAAASAWLKSDEPQHKEYPTIIFGEATGQGRQLLPLSQAGYWISQTSSVSAPAFGRVVSEAVGDQDYEASIEVERDSILMLKATYHPNWHAFVDSGEVKTVMLMPSLIGIPVSLGNHTVRLAYQSEPLRGDLMRVGVLALLLIALVEWRRDALGQLASRIKLGEARGTAAEKILSTLSQVPALRALTNVGRKQAERSTGNSSIPFKTKLGIYLLFFSIYLMSGAGHFFSTDHIAVYLTAQSLVENHNLTIKPIYDAVRGHDGNYYSNFGLGQAIASTPLYLVGKWVDAVGSPSLKRYFAGVNLSDWGGTVPIFFVSLFNQFISPLTCVLFLLFCLRLGFSFRVSFLSTLIFGFATATWVYARDSFQHPLETLLLLLSIYILFANQAALRPRHALVSGMALAYGFLTRINLLVVVPAIFLYLFAMVPSRNPKTGVVPRRPQGEWTGSLGTRLREALRSLQHRVIDDGVLGYLVAFSAPILAMLAFILWLNDVKFGHYFTFHVQGQEIGFSIPIWLGLYGNLFSVGRSILLYSPPTLLALFAIGEFYRQHRRETILFCSIVAVYLITYSTYGYWDGGWSWGPRFLLPLVPFLMLPMGDVLNTRKGQIAAGVVAALGIGVQILGVAVNYSYVYWDWAGMNLFPANAFLFVPSISAIPMHFFALMAGRHIDLWLLEVLSQFGSGVFLWTLAVPLSILTVSLALLRNERSETEGVVEPVRPVAAMGALERSGQPTT